MEFDPKDYDIVALLTKLKNVNGSYPSWLLASRREIYFRQVANLKLGVGLGRRSRKGKAQAKAAKGISLSRGTLLEIVFIIAIIAEAITAAYIYRDKITKLIQSSTSSPEVEEVVLPPSITSPFPDIYATETPVGTVTPIITPTGTQLTPGSVNSEGNNQITSTPDPNGNNGNHYGQTPKPERTKSPNPTKSSNDKPPKSTKKP